MVIPNGEPGKVHISLDVDSQQIMLAKLIPNSTTDGEAGVEMLQELAAPPSQVSGDGGHDKRKFYQECQTQQIAKITVPPQQNAKVGQHGNCKQPPHPCDENLRYIRHHGRKKWKRDHNYHQC